MSRKIEKTLVRFLQNTYCWALKISFTTFLLACPFFNGNSATNLVVAQVIPFVPDQGFNVQQFSEPIYLDNNFEYSSPSPLVDNNVFYSDNVNSQIPFNNSFSTSIPTDQSYQYSTSIPQTIENANITGTDGSNYVILGDVTGPFNFGGSQFDNIPFLNEGTKTPQKLYPELKIPQSDEEFATRVDALYKRFSNANLPISTSTPSRILRYSLIGGADETFLAPNMEQNKINGETAGDQSSMKPMYALGALCWNIPCAQRRLMRVVNNHPVPEVGFGFQAQRGEFLATLAFAKIDRNYELRVDNKAFTVQDLVEWEKYSCSNHSNLSLVAIGLAHYSQNPDETWINQFGETWSLQRILEHESRRSIDWNTADSTDKLLAFTYLLARLKQSPHAQSPNLASTIQKTEYFLLAVKKRVWELYGDSGLSESLFFNSEIKLTTPHMKLYVNGKLLRWLTMVSSSEELNDPKMKKANAELCALVDQLFNSQKDLSLASSTDEESFAVALQTLVLYRRQVMQATATIPSESTTNHH